jgi:hypothetical protein
VTVIGSLNSTRPSWTCYVDGQAFLKSASNTNTASNNVEICTLSGIVVGTTPSNLTVVASGTTDNPFLLDYIQYTPLASDILQDTNATILVNVLDSQIQYDSNWNKSEGQVETSVNGASMTFDFIGGPQGGLPRSFKYFL